MALGNRCKSRLSGAPITNYAPSYMNQRFDRERVVWGDKSFKGGEYSDRLQQWDTDRWIAANEEANRLCGHCNSPKWVETMLRVSYDDTGLRLKVVRSQVTPSGYAIQCFGYERST